MSPDRKRQLEGLDANGAGAVDALTKRTRAAADPTVVPSPSSIGHSPAVGPGKGAGAGASYPKKR